jgi:thymidine phosphorylase
MRRSGFRGTPLMLPQEIIRSKRDGAMLSRKQIADFVAGITDGRVGDEQLGAFAMAVFLNGMNETETVALTTAMRDSGRVMRWDGLDGPVLDKHSTGGVGDAVSLILGPWVAACGGYVPMISGPGLGHTGGTLDKLQAIPGYDPFPTPERLARVVEENGVAIIGQTDDLAPADRRFYGVRDVTATVECLPLIVASILSKKLAAGLDALVMDVKVGSGSVMGSLARADALARAIARVATDAGMPTHALLTDMDQVLARSAGNALEVAECIAILRGEAESGRMLAVTRELAIEMLLLGRLAEDRDRAVAKLDRVLASGEAAERFARMVCALGGPADLLDHPDRHLPVAAVRRAVYPNDPGIIQQIDVREVGLAVVELGGGRRRGGESIDLSVGLSEVAAIGETVDRQRPLAIVHAADAERARLAALRLQNAFSLGPDPVEPPQLVRQRIVLE